MNEEEVKQQLTKFANEVSEYARLIRKEVDNWHSIDLNAAERLARMAAEVLEEAAAAAVGED